VARDSATRWGRLAAVADSMELGRSGRSIMRRRGPAASYRVIAKARR
jgi:hypothetical protein